MTVLKFFDFQAHRAEIDWTSHVPILPPWRGCVRSWTHIYKIGSNLVPTMGRKTGNFSV